jgi:hypothetical protein
MIVAQITGGLGNQMFQFAAAKALSLHYNCELKLDLQNFNREILPELEVNRQFELPAFKNFTYQEASKADIKKFEPKSFLDKKVQQLLPKHKRSIYSEKEYPYDEKFFSARKSIYIKGHRQSEKYFSSYQNEIRSIYTLRDDLINEVEGFKSELDDRNTVAVHVRRGDYLRLPIILDWHGVLSKEYYFSALEYLSEHIPNLKILYFSDDIEWVKNELMPTYPGMVVSDNISKTHYHDFYLIQSCKHQIVANSSFSWWAAWLNPNPDKIVIAPKKWFNNAPYDTRDLIPDSWIKM